MDDIITEETEEYRRDSNRRRDAGVGQDAAMPRDGVPKIDSILRIPVRLQVLVGSATLPVADLLKLGHGAVIPLDSRVGDPVEVVVNGRSIARGEVVIVEDDSTRFGVSLTEICEPQLNDGR